MFLSLLSIPVRAPVSYIIDFQKWDSVFRIPQYTATGFSNSVYEDNERLEWNITVTGALARQYMINNPNHTFTIESINLVWYYQDRLDSELNVSEYDFVNATHAILNGSTVTYRPLNVVGSYAVYHSSLRNNEYETGKVFHLYRPLLIDDSGNTSWGWLNVTGSTLTIGWDQSWMSNAVFPIIIDPTFGYTSIGATYSGDGTANYIIGFYGGSIYTPASSGTVTSISIYESSSSGTTNVQFAVYTDGSESSKIDITESGTANTTARWITLDGTLSGSVSSGTDYTICHNTETVNCGFRYDTSTGNYSQFNAQTFGTWPSTIAWSNRPYRSNRVFSAYVTYSTGGASYSFQLNQTLLLFSNMLSSKSLSFQSGQTLTLYSSLSGNNALSFLTSQTVILFSNLVSGKSLNFRASQTLNLFSSVTINNALAFLQSQTLILQDTLLSIKNMNYASFQTLPVYDNNMILKRLNFLQGDTLTLYDSLLSIKSLTFWQSQTLTLFSSLGYSLETAIKNLQFTFTQTLSLLDSLGARKELSFLKSQTLILFDSSMFSHGVYVEFGEWIGSQTLRLYSDLGALLPTGALDYGILALGLGFLSFILALAGLGLHAIHRKNQD